MRNKKAKKLQYKTIRNAVEKTVKEYKVNVDAQQIDMIAQVLKDINDILANAKRNGTFADDKLFAICEKEPRGNLDTGRHYYSVHYVIRGGIHKAWFWEFITVLGGYDQNRDRNLDKYIFGSGAIGMSRLLDATDGLFRYLKIIGGFYHQLHCR